MFGDLNKMNLKRVQYGWWKSDTAKTNWVERDKKCRSRTVYSCFIFNKIQCDNSCVNEHVRHGVRTLWMPSVKTQQHKWACFVTITHLWKLRITLRFCLFSVANFVYLWMLWNEMRRLNCISRKWRRCCRHLAVTITDRTF